MKKRLLALLLIVCFVVAIPCHGFAVNTATSNSNDKQEAVVQQNKGTDAATEAQSVNVASSFDSTDCTTDGLGLINPGKPDASSDNNKQEIVSQKKIATQLASTSSVVNGESFFDSLYCTTVCDLELLYPGDKVYIRTQRPGQSSSQWETITIAYGASRRYTDQWVVSGFVTNGVSCAYAVDPFVYRTPDLDDNMGQIGEVGINHIEDDLDRDYAFVYLDQGYEVVNITPVSNIPLKASAELSIGTPVYAESGGTVYNAHVKSTNIGSLYGYLDGIGGVVYYSVAETSSRLNVGVGEVLYGPTDGGNARGILGVVMSHGADSTYFTSVGFMTNARNIKPTAVNEITLNLREGSGGKSELYWDSIPNAYGYLVYQRTGSSGKFEFVEPTVTNSFTIDVSNDDSYGREYIVLGVDKYDNVKLSKTLKMYSGPVWRDVAYNGSGFPILSWENPVNGTSSFELYRSENKESGYELIKTLPYGVTSYTDTSSKLKIGKPYYYKIRTSSDYGLESTVLDATRKYTAPYFIGIAHSYGNPKLQWQKVDGATEYAIYRYDEQKGIYVHHDTAYNGKTYYIDYSAQIGEIYSYKIKVKKGTANVDSEFSQVITEQCKYAYPDLVSVTKSGNNLVIKWDSVYMATQYQLEYATSDGGTYTPLPPTTGTTYTFNNIASNQAYYFRVKVLDAPGSNYSQVKGYAPAPQLMDTRDKHSFGRPKLQWKAVKGARRYEIYRYSPTSKKYVWIKNVYNKTYYNDFDTTLGNWYTYEIRVGGTVKSDFTDIIELQHIYEYPTITKIENGSDGKPVIKWSSVSGATRYELAYSSDNGKSYTVISNTISGTSSTHGSAVKGNKYRYRIRVYNGYRSDYYYSSYYEYK